MATIGSTELCISNRSTVTYVCKLHHHQCCHHQNKVRYVCMLVSNFKWCPISITSMMFPPRVELEENVHIQDCVVELFLEVCSLELPRNLLCCPTHQTTAMVRSGNIRTVVARFLTMEKHALRMCIHTKTLGMKIFNISPSYAMSWGAERSRVFAACVSKMDM